MVSEDTSEETATQNQIQEEEEMKSKIYRVKYYCPKCHIRIMPYEPEAGFYKGEKWHLTCLSKEKKNVKDLHRLR